MEKLTVIWLCMVLGACPAQGKVYKHLEETRYCGEPARHPDGTIKRSRSVIRAFEKRYPLPSHYDRNEWQIDHVIPLQAGGVDAVHNMQWLPKALKTCAGNLCKDRWERLVYVPKQEHTTNCE